MTRLARLALATTILSFLLAAVGGLVRATDSGMGCPGWPKCYGRWLPPADHHAVIEMSHRYLASAVSVGVIATCLVAVLFHRHDRVVFRLGLAIVPLVLAQALLGAYVVGRELEPWTVVAHLGLAMAFAATLILLTVHLLVPPTGAGPRRLVWMLGGVAMAVFAQLLLGSWVTGRNAGLAFVDWPLFDGRVIPANLGSEAPALHFAHRVWGYVVALGLVYAAARVRADYHRSQIVRRFASAGAFLVGAQIAIGALNIYSRLHAAVVTAHLAVATLIWGAAVTAWAAARRTAPALASPSGAPVEPDVGIMRAAPAVPPRAGARVEEDAAGAGAGRRVSAAWPSRARAYLALTKPRIIELLLVTTVPTMVVAERGLPPPGLVATTVLGGALAAGGANAVNMYVDRDIDRLMKRTRRRPLVTGSIEPRYALGFALGLEVLAFAVLALAVNLLSALLGLAAALFYIFVYTLWLKRRSPNNIVVGGAAGAMPVLVGWAAVTGTLGWAPFVLFALVFVWTPPHFWALAIRYRDDYVAARVPMLPAVATAAATARHIVAYTLAVLAVSLVFLPAAGMGLIYLAAAVLLGGLFVFHAVRLQRGRSPEQAMRLFGYSISYLTLLFGAMALDQLVRLPV